MPDLANYPIAADVYVSSERTPERKCVADVNNAGVVHVWLNNEYFIEVTVPTTPRNTATVCVQLYHRSQWRRNGETMGTPAGGGNKALAIVPRTRRSVHIELR